MYTDIFANVTTIDSPSILIQFLSILGLFILTVLTPGPDFLAVVQSSLNRGLKTGLMTVLGIGTGLLFHCTYCVLGITWLMEKTPVLFTIIKVIGGLYIGYLGIQTFRNNSIVPIEIDSCTNSVSQTQSVLSRGGFVTGLLVNVLNVKAMLWLTFFYSTVIPESFTLFHRTLFAICSIISAIVTFSLIAIFISIPIVRSLLQKAGYFINIVIGVAFLFIAGKILLELIQ